MIKHSENKKRVCKEYDIDLEAGIRFEDTDFLSSMDICSLFVNCLDNAIEAVKDLDGDKQIELAGGWVNDTLVVRIQNVHQNVLRVENGKYLSTKAETGHGYGLKNVIRIVEKHGGTCTIKQEQNKFVVTWMIPRPELTN